MNRLQPKVGDQAWYADNFTVLGYGRGKAPAVLHVEITEAVPDCTPDKFGGVPVRYKLADEPMPEDRDSWFGSTAAMYDTKLEALKWALNRLKDIEASG